MAALNLWLQKSKPHRVSATSGTIRPERLTAWFTVASGGVFCLLAIAILLTDPSQSLIAAVVGVMGLAIAGFMFPSVTSIHAVNWDEDGIEGPSKTFGPTLGLARTRIAWADIVGSATTITSYWYIKAADGRRIYWSYLYKGHGALADALARYRPDLSHPDGD